jgi:hypothetical protein
MSRNIILNITCPTGLNYFYRPEKGFLNRIAAGDQPCIYVRYHTESILTIAYHSSVGIRSIISSGEIK